MQDNIQLKQEEIVGNEVVLSDINPKTSSNSVTDSATGVQLNETLEKMWNSINNKLTRIVNSVNGRTGVVVLRSEDVGLGNVDNVSFGDIKQWVIDLLIAEFGNKRLKLFEDFSQLDVCLAKNDKSDRDSAYFIEHLNSVDTRSYIGYIYLDEPADRLSYMQMPINTIGATDNSINYKLSDDDGVETDYGTISVNISEYEDALYVYNGLNKKASGLAIRGDKIAGNLYFYEGVYGNGEVDDPDALIYLDNTIPPEGSQQYECKIYIDKVEIGKEVRDTPFYAKRNFKKGDIIICNFDDYRVVSDKVNMFPGVIGNNPSIGMVTQAPTRKYPNTVLIIEFYTIKPRAGWGIEYVRNHTASAEYFHKDYELNVKLAGGLKAGISEAASMAFDGRTYNMSGLQVIAGDNSSSLFDPRGVAHVEDCLTYTVLPEGPTKVFDIRNSGGLLINPDVSMCVIPYVGYGHHIKNENGSYSVDNWCIDGSIPKKETQSAMGINQDFPTSHGISDSMSFLGINLRKVVEKGDRTLHEDEILYGETHSMKFTNVSGLKIYPSDANLMPGDLGMVGEPSRYGKTDKYSSWTDDGDTTGGPVFDSKTSGGLAINVGKYLEISPGETHSKSDEYYDGGKVNVRIGNGLKDDGHNKITVDAGNGISINDGKLTIKSGQGIMFDNDGRVAVNIAQDYGCSAGLMFYSPGGSHEPAVLGIKYHRYGLRLDKDGYLETVIDTNSGLEYKDTFKPQAEGGLGIEKGIAIKVNNSNRLKVDENGLDLNTDYMEKLVLEDSSGNTIEYDPFNDGDDTKPVKKILLGPGLKIVNEEPTEEGSE